MIELVVVLWISPCKNLSVLHAEAGMRDLRSVRRGGQIHLEGFVAFVRLVANAVWGYSWTRLMGWGMSITIRQYLCLNESLKWDY